MNQEARAAAPDFTSSRISVERRARDAERLLAESHAEDEERCRQPSGNCDLDTAQLVQQKLLTGNDDWPVARPERSAMGKERIAVLHERVRRKRQRSHLELALEGPLVQHLDVLRHELELEPPRVEPSGNKPQAMNASSGSAE